MVKKDQLVSINYVLTDDKGQILDQSQDEPLDYIHGHGLIISGLEKALEGHKAGDKLEVNIPAKDAYGEYDAERCLAVDRDQIGDGEPKVGMMARLSTDDGIIVARIIKVTDKEVVFDANHPLAGKALNFSVEIATVRPATEEELQMAHGCGHDCGDDGCSSCHSCSGCH